MHKGESSLSRKLKTSIQIIMLVLITLIFLAFVLPYFARELPELFAGRCQNYLTSIVSEKGLLFFEAGFVYALLMGLFLGKRKTIISGIGINIAACMGQILQWSHTPGVFVAPSEFDAIPSIECLSEVPSHILFSIVALVIPLLISGAMALELGCFVQALIHQTVGPSHS